MPEQGTKPVNQYLPPRERSIEDDASHSLVAMAEAQQPQGFWKWVDSALDKISGEA